MDGSHRSLSRSTFWSAETLVTCAVRARCVQAVSPRLELDWGQVVRFTKGLQSLPMIQAYKEVHDHV